MPTTSYGYELSIGDDADLNDTPVCCDDDMAAKDSGRGREYTCRTCRTAVFIAPNGLVDYISA